MAMNPQRALDVCDEATRLRLEDLFHVRWGSDAFGPEELEAMLPGSDMVITSWGTPPIGTDFLGGTNFPNVVAHAAGTVKNLVDPDVFGKGVSVFSAASRLASSVGEYCLAAALTMLRQLPEFDASMRRNIWRPAGLRGRELSGQRVGIVGASTTARAFIALLKPFHCDVVVYDPYLSPERAAELGVRLAPLEEVAASTVLSIHVPNLPETEGMITAELLRSMPDGGILINSSRGPAMDYEALSAEVSCGRLFAALDVFPQEPPTLSTAMAVSPNVLLSPHIAGDSVDGHRALVGFVLDDVLAWLDSGHRGPSYVDPAVLAFSA